MEQENLYMQGTPSGVSCYYSFSIISILGFNLQVLSFWSVNRQYIISP